MPVPILPSALRWPLHDAAATRRLEQQALQDLPEHALIERAGLAVARLALAVAPHAETIWVAAGGGNNGGDGLIAARHLVQAGRTVRATVFGDPARMPPDAKHAFETARAAGVLFEDTVQAATGATLVIDALLGIGASQPPREAIAGAITLINGLGSPVLAIDLPSGLPADTGHAADHAAVRADHTLSLLTLKPGLFSANGRDHAGRVWFDALGTAQQALADAACAWLIGPPSSPPRQHAQHKGSFGDVIAVGGAPGMAGAPLMAARAAQLAGAGRVLLARLDGQPLASALHWPELMQRLPEDVLRPEVLSRATVVGGCGGGEAIASALPILLAGAPRLVLDADALNAVARTPALRSALIERATREQHTVLTPHPLEAARLLGCTTAEVQADRLRVAQRLADDLRLTVVLKGSGTVIASPARLPQLNPTGNARLATAGSGDVLAGWIAGLWAARGGHHADAAADAAAAAVWLHGQAADSGDEHMPLTASGLLDAIARPPA